MTRQLILVLALAASAIGLPAQSVLGNRAFAHVDWASPDARRAQRHGSTPQGIMAIDADADPDVERRRVELSLAGTWTLVAADEVRPDGTRVQAYGANPEGQMILDRSGHYSVFVVRAMHTKFKSGVKANGTAEEYKAASLEVSAHYGRYAVDVGSHTLTFDIVHASFPNLDGTEQRRPFELTGDQLSYRIPPRADGTVSISVWRRDR